MAEGITLTHAALVVGGGIASQFLRIFAFRDRDAAKFRADLINQLGELRERVAVLETQLASKSAEVHRLRKANFRFLLREHEFKHEVNALCARLSEPARYDTDVALPDEPPSAENDPRDPSAVAPHAETEQRE